MSGLNEAITAIHLRNSAAAPPPAPRAVALPRDDDAEASGVDLGEAEGQSFMIDYVNSKGEASSRRITVWGVKEGAGGIPLLVARCHERNRTRTFRTDRIRCCIDYDGEVHEDVPAFLNETFGMSLVAASRVEIETPATPNHARLPAPVKQTSLADDRSEWSRARSYLRPHAEILAALSLRDGVMRDAEVGIAVRHCNQIAEASGFAIQTEQTKLTAYIKRLRPTEKTLTKAVTRLAEAPPHEVTDLLISAVELMDVDGQRHPAEVELVNQMSRELASIDMA